MERVRGLPSWTFAATFVAPQPSRLPRRPPDFEGLRPFLNASRLLWAGTTRALLAELVRSDATLAGFGGDPLRTKWSTFRPLRLSREEDWSDWLAHLLETSTEGALPRALLGGETPAVTPTARRELRIGPRRLDILLEFSALHLAHIEVKVGDRDFEKTWDTARRTESEHPSSKVDHYILLLREDRDRFEAWAARAPRQISLAVLTWDDVTAALRRTIAGEQGLSWRAFARALSGAVEQGLLGFPWVPAGATEPAPAPWHQRWLDITKAAS